LLIVYYAFAYPYLLYAVEVYGNTCPTYIDKLSKLNNKLLRILQHKEFRSHVPTLYSEYNTSPVTLIHEQQLLILAHKIIHHSESVPEIFIDYLNLHDSVHRHDTRTKNDMHILRVSTGHGLRCLKYKIPKLWNELPKGLKELTSFNGFKQKLKLYLTTKLHIDNCFVD